MAFISVSSSFKVLFESGSFHSHLGGKLIILHNGVLHNGVHSLCKDIKIWFHSFLMSKEIEPSLCLEQID